MKVIILKNPKTESSKSLMNLAKNLYNGSVYKLSVIDKVTELVELMSWEGRESMKHKKLIQDVSTLSASYNETVLNSTLDFIDSKKGNNLFFIEIRDDDKLNVFVDKYKEDCIVLLCSDLENTSFLEELVTSLIEL